MLIFATGFWAMDALIITIDGMTSECSDIFIFLTSFALPSLFQFSILRGVPLHDEPVMPAPRENGTLANNIVSAELTLLGITNGQLTASDFIFA